MIEKNLIWIPFQEYQVNQYFNHNEILKYVGGKNANLIWMTQLAKNNIQIPPGVAISTILYHKFLDQNPQIETEIDKLSLLLHNYVDEPKYWIQQAENIRKMFYNSSWNKDIEEWLKITINQQLLKWNNELYKNMGGIFVAIRSSATAEDLPNASFAGQQDTYLMLKEYKDIRQAIIACYASLWNDRAIQYRYKMAPNMKIRDIAMSVVLQIMVRSDLGSAGVAFSIDPESGYKDTIVINGAWGLGEAVVQGNVIPDEWIFQKQILKEGIYHGKLSSNIAKKEIACRWNENQNDTLKTLLVNVPEGIQKVPCLPPNIAHKLAKWVLMLEESMSHERGVWTPVDVEWAFEPCGPSGLDGKLWIVQVRAETVHSQKISNNKIWTQYGWKNKCAPPESELWFNGIAVGQKIMSGPVVYIKSIEQLRTNQIVIPPGAILATHMTDPDWEPWMRKSAGMITDQGGRTCHAAIIAREMGIPAIVGTLKGTTIIREAIAEENGNMNNVSHFQVTIDCSSGEIGHVWKGSWETETQSVDLSQLPEPNTWETGLWLNVGSPERAFNEAQYPAGGVGLARLEFIISQWIGIHPGLLDLYDNNPDKVPEWEWNELQEKLLPGESGKEFYIRKITDGVARIGGAFYPRKVIVRFSDFKSNEYRTLLGGDMFEPIEENPMIGWRGASRYVKEPFDKWFLWECEAIKKAREIIGCTNVAVMIPFCRTPNECDNVLKQMEKGGLVKGTHSLKVFLMCEIPSNVILAEEFLSRVDGYSIGSNDLTQLTLGLDRDQGLVAHLYDERNPAILKSLENVISTAKNLNKKIGICGQAPSDFPEFAVFLQKCGIHTISVVSESFWKTALHLFSPKPNPKEIYNYTIIIDAYTQSIIYLIDYSSNIITKFKEIFTDSLIETQNTGITIYWNSNGDFIRQILKNNELCTFSIKIESNNSL